VPGPLKEASKSIVTLNGPATAQLAPLPQIQSSEWVVDVLTPTTLPSDLTAAPIVPDARSKNDAAEFGPSVTALLVVPLDSGGVLVLMSLMRDCENVLGSAQAVSAAARDSNDAENAMSERVSRARVVGRGMGWRFIVMADSP